VNVPPAARGAPSKLFVEVTSRCNLRCAMCVKQAAPPGGREGDLAQATFARLAPALPGLDALVLNGVGEPLLHPGLEGFVAAARQAMPERSWIGFQTNGQLLGPRRARALADAGVDRVCLSADAASPALFEALRGGGRQDVLVRAAQALQAAGRGRARPLEVGLEFVAMRENLGQLPDVVRLAARLGARFVIVTHLLPYAAALRDAAAFDASSDRAVAIFTRAQARAAADGVDLARYFEVFLKLRSTPADRRVIEAVRATVAEAAADGVFLPVRRLLRRDVGVRGRVEEAFAEAVRVGAAEGVAVRLPEVAPRLARRCPFVEEGGAFVSWSGDVHPCHFLWHACSTHAAGLVKHVLPVSLGNVAERPLLDIWASARARAFRDEVLRYEAPFCYDCSFAMCDYVQDGTSSEDCRLGTVPCAACLWGTGVLQCLS
jgi:putative metalloenzyme radical SAM/SPASM domain maturase